MTWPEICYIYGQENATFGTCDIPKLAPPPPAAAGSQGPTQSSTNGAYMESRPALQWLFGTVMAATLLLLLSHQ